MVYIHILRKLKHAISSNLGQEMMFLCFEHKGKSSDPLGLCYNVCALDWTHQQSIRVLNSTVVARDENLEVENTKKLRNPSGVFHCTAASFHTSIYIQAYISHGESVLFDSKIHVGRN